MGKPFSKELTRLSVALRWANELDVTPITDFFDQARGQVLSIIGAGGSFTGAEMARLLHEERGGIALAHTPLSFLQSGTDFRGTYIVLMTASGNNRDILSTYEEAVRRESQGILIICGRKDSKIEKLARSCERTVVFARPLPTGRDGYLATNSLAAFCALTVRGFGFPTIDEAAVIKAAEEAARTWSRVDLPNGPSYFLALFGGWGRPAAVDFESKLSEAGLAGAMLADYRNFAHGRHNWIHKKGAHSVVVAFITPDSQRIAAKTLSLLPADTRIIRIASSKNGPEGAMALLLTVFHLTALIGRHVGIDPGRPGVPSYGRKIYHLGPRWQPALVMPSPVHRKLAARGTIGNVDDREIAWKAMAEFRARLSKPKYGAIVVDFDGTVVRPGADRNALLSKPVAAFFTQLLKNRIRVYFATGRGDSIHSVLAESLPAVLHPQIFISYYNGSVTRALSESPPKPEGGTFHREFDALLDQLKSDHFVSNVAKPDNKSFQLTLKATKQAEFPAASTAVRELIARHGAGLFRVVQSSHSLDVIPWATSKLECVRFAQSHLADGMEVLTIGDRGAMTGNDYDLLTHRYSLSVDSVSADLGSCWNLLPAGSRNVAGLIWYARAIKIRRGSFTLSIPKVLC
jgi:hydroxymethylpyrimidine pyrophosphatase-like HAD family hydrolase